MPPGRLSIELTHTLAGTSGDRLTGYGALVDWAEHVSLATGSRARALHAFGESHPEQASALHARAIRLRDDLYAVLVAASEGQEPAPERLEILNALLRESAAHRALAHGTAGYEWMWAPEAVNRPEALLWPIAHSAAELLTSEWLDRVGVCSADTCGWLFVDESRNRSRRWCDMKDCGNRAKVRRYRARARGA